MFSVLLTVDAPSLETQAVKQSSVVGHIFEKL